MSEELGPLITLRIMLISILPSVFATMFWIHGHLVRLVLDNNEVKIPFWLLEYVDIEQTKQRISLYNVYILKGIAWTINFSWILFLLSEPGCGRWIEENCVPFYSNAAFHNIALLDIGGIVVELVLFFALTGYFRWGIIREK